MIINRGGVLSPDPKAGNCTATASRSLPPRPRKKARHLRRAKSREKNAASHLQRRKLRTFRTGRLCLFTHSTAATGGQLNREIMLMSTAYDLAISAKVSPAARRLSASLR